MLSGKVAAIIQNTLNTSSNALGLIKRLNTQATVNEALSRALSPR